MKVITYLVALLFCFNGYDANSQTDDSRMDRATFTNVAQMPEYPGCEAILDPTARKNCAYKSMIQYLSDNIVYPTEAKAAKLEGSVVVSFIVSKEGEITKAQVVKGFDKACEAEALRVIQEMPKWVPGAQEGKEVAVSMNLPIRFTL
ncbi:MAG: protein TonB [Polaribacter sp.]|jgi:protein TonB